MVSCAGSEAMTGATKSTTVMVWDVLEIFPQPSVAVHVLVVLYEPAHAPCVTTSEYVRVNALPQASVAVAIAKTGVAGHAIVEGAGKEDITGGVVSMTLIVWELVEEFPQTSRAVHVRVTLYSPAQSPAVVAST